MKYIVVLADGMADEPIEQLNNKTPLEYAKTPYFDLLSSKGEIGLVNTIPEGMSPGSDTANLSVMGYDAKKYYSGRSPLEAISIGAEMLETDVCFRVNFVTLTEEEPYAEKIILDHSSDEITTEEAKELLKVIQNHFGSEERHFYPGVSYRHALIWNKGSMKVELIPPHNILGKSIGAYLPQGDHSDFMRHMMETSFELLNQHPINIKRREKGLRPANSVWPWGEGTKPLIPPFEELFNKKGAVISAVDLLKGIAIAAKMNSIDVEGATGNLHTNYAGKVNAAIEALENGADFVYIHIEGPDECGHRGEIDNKVLSIEWIDEKVVGPIYTYFSNKKEPFKLAVLPDHPTPIRLRTHTNLPIPYFIYSSEIELSNEHKYTEEGAKHTGNYFHVGHEFMKYFLNN
jgi:2,3-bisphosphoglycerate-independent phosphoglycerate mutase